jgi:hypothetical protein
VEEADPRTALQFVRSVAVLALDAAGQEAWLGRAFNGTVVAVAELEIEFDEGFALLPSFVARGWLDEAALPALTRLDEHLDAMSGDHNRHLWQVEALTSRAEGAQARDLARAALILLV